MAGRGTFSSKLVGGFALTVGLSVLMGVTAVVALNTVTDSKDAVITTTSRELFDSQQLSTVAEQRIGDYRAYMLTGADEQLQDFAADREQFLAHAAALRDLFTAPAKIDLLNRVLDAENAYAAALDPTVEQRKSITSLVNISQINTTRIAPTRKALQAAIAELIDTVHADAEQARKASTRTATVSIVLVWALMCLAVISAVLIAVRLSRRLRRQVGSAIGHIQSSSAQLEAAATRQANGGRHQASAMNQITTTISELLITSRQIADSAQRVAKVAEETADAAHNGDATIDQTRQSIAAIRAQVDRIVQHMLALGEKSQQIGGVVDLVSELAEQTNILAINATIEASGAGEWGRRFSVVAEEIRKLADRTAGSAREIRVLIDDVQTAVNTTVMATEIGAKAVDSGAQQFDEATDSFRRIADLVSTATDATREIELSTKQQTTAVEQVNVAAADTARVTGETETSAIQTKQTAAHLSMLSSELQQLVGAGRS